MAAKYLFLPILCLYGFLTGCSTSMQTRDEPFLAPASGETVLMAAKPPLHSNVETGEATYAELRFDDLERFTKWTSVLDRLDHHETLPPPWRQNKARLAGMSIAERARIVNDLVNSYPYIEDWVSGGGGDNWDAPQEFFARGGGDCEDFAIAKYAMLRDLGVPEDNLRITVVYDRYLRNMHALLALHMPQEVLLLDNQIASLRSPEAASRYRPIFGLGRKSWWLYRGQKAV